MPLLLKKSLLLPFFILLFSIINAQDISGEWNGYLSQDDKSWQFTMQVTITQTGSELSGIAKYTAYDGAYVRHKFTGTFKQDILYLKETSVLEDGSNGRYMWCIKLLTGALTRSDDEYTLEGSWKNDGLRGFAYGQHVNNFSNCPPGIFHITKKFTCKQDMANRIDTKLSAWLEKGRYESTPDWKLRTTDANTNNHVKKLLQETTQTILDNSNFKFDYDADAEIFTVKSSCIDNFLVRVPRAEAECFETNFNKSWLKQISFAYNKGKKSIAVDSFRIVSTCQNKAYIYPEAKQRPPEPEVQPELPKPKPARKIQILDTVEVLSPNVTIMLYDNGTIDGDSVSVYLDNKILEEKRLLTAKPIMLKLTLEPGREYIIEMLAHNLGKIPPNTALMLIEDGNSRKEIRISSTLLSSGAIQLNIRKSK